MLRAFLVALCATVCVAEVALQGSPRLVRRRLADDTVLEYVNLTLAVSSPFADDDVAVLQLEVEGGRTLNVSVRAHPTVYELDLESQPLVLIPELVRPLSWTQCLGVQAPDSRQADAFGVSDGQEDVLGGPVLAPSTAAHLTENVTVPVGPFSRRLLSLGERVFLRKEHVARIRASRLLHTLDQASIGHARRLLQSASTPSVKPIQPSVRDVPNTYAWYARMLCINHQMTECEADASCPWRTTFPATGARFETFRRQAFEVFRNHQWPIRLAHVPFAVQWHPSNPLATITASQTDGYVADAPLLGTCRFESPASNPSDPRAWDVQLIEGRSCRPLCPTCTAAERQAMERMTGADFAVSPLRAKLIEAPYVYGGVTTSLAYGYLSEPGSECPCSPRNATFYRVCPSNPWSNPRVTGQLQFCTKASGDGFQCVPFTDKALRRELGPMRTAEHTCSTGDKLRAAFSSPKCASITCGVVVGGAVAGAAVGAAIVSTGGVATPGIIVAAGAVNGAVAGSAFGVDPALAAAGCGCEEWSITKRDDSARVYEMAESLQVLKAISAQLSASMNATKEAALRNREVEQRLVEMLRLQNNVTGHLRDYGQSSRLLISTIMSRLNTSFVRVGALQAAALQQNENLEADFAERNAFLTNLQSEVGSFFADAAHMLETYQAQLSIQERMSSEQQARTLEVATTVQEAMFLYRGVLNQVVRALHGGSRFRGMVRALHRQLERVRHADGWIPFVSDYNSETGEYAFRPHEVLPPDHRYKVLETQQVLFGAAASLRQLELRITCDLTQLVPGAPLALQVTDLPALLNCRQTTGQCLCWADAVLRECQPSPALVNHTVASLTAAFRLDVALDPSVSRLCASPLVTEITTIQPDDWSALSNFTTQLCQEDMIGTLPASALGPLQDSIVVTSLGTGGKVRASARPLLRKECQTHDPYRMQVLTLPERGNWMLDVLIQLQAAVDARLGSAYFRELDYFLTGQVPRLGFLQESFPFGSPESTPPPNTAAKSYDVTRGGRSNASVASANARNDRVVASLQALYPNQTWTRERVLALSENDLLGLLGLGDVFANDTLHALNTTSYQDPHDCIRWSFLTTGPNAMPVRWARTRSVNRQVDVRVGPSTTFNPTWQQSLQSRLADQTYTNADVLVYDAYSSYLATPFAVAGYLSCALGLEPCPVPKAGVADGNTPDTSDFYWYDPSETDLVQSLPTTVSGRRTSQYLHLKTSANCSEDSWSGCASPPTAGACASRLLARHSRTECPIPMFSVEEYWNQQGLDASRPQVPGNEYNPLHGGASPELFRVPLSRRRITRYVAGWRPGEANRTVDIWDMSCIRPREHFQRLCSILDKYYVRVTTTARPDSWTRLFLQPKVERLQVTVGLPVYTSLRVVRAAGRGGCPYEMRVERGRGHGEWTVVALGASQSLLYATCSDGSRHGAIQLRYERTSISPCETVQFSTPEEALAGGNASLSELEVRSAADGSLCSLWRLDASSFATTSSVEAELQQDVERQVQRSFDMEENRSVLWLMRAGQLLGDRLTWLYHSLWRSTREGMGVTLPEAENTTLPLLPQPRSSSTSASATTPTPSDVQNATALHESLGGTSEDLLKQLEAAMAENPAVHDLYLETLEAVTLRLRELETPQNLTSGVQASSRLLAELARIDAETQEFTTRANGRLVDLSALVFEQDFVLQALETGAFDNLTDADFLCLWRMGAIFKDPGMQATLESKLAVLGKRLIYEVPDLNGELPIVDSKPWTWLNWAPPVWRNVLWLSFWLLLIQATLLLIVMVPLLHCGNACCGRWRTWMLGRQPAVYSSLKEEDTPRRQAALAGAPRMYQWRR